MDMPIEKTIIVMFQNKPHPITINYCPFHEFESSILSLLKIKSNIAIKYQDFDKDWIVVGCDEEVKEALTANTIQVCERPAQSYESCIKFNTLSEITSLTKKKSTLKQRAAGMDICQHGNGVLATQFTLPDTAEMDRDLQNAFLRRLQHRAYESRSERISRFDSEELNATNEEPSSSLDNRRVKWEVGSPELGKVKQDHVSAPSAKASPIAVCRRPLSPQPSASGKAMPLNSAAARPAPVQPSYAAAVAAGPHVRQQSCVLPRQRLAGLGLSLSTHAPFMVRAGSVLRDFKGVKNGDLGYSNPPIEQYDRCPALTCATNLISLIISLLTFRIFTRGMSPDCT
jgi:hypothetical protein